MNISPERLAIRRAERRKQESRIWRLTHRVEIKAERERVRLAIPDYRDAFIESHTDRLLRLRNERAVCPKCKKVATCWNPDDSVRCFNPKCRKTVAA